MIFIFSEEKLLNTPRASSVVLARHDWGFQYCLVTAALHSHSPWGFIQNFNEAAVRNNNKQFWPSTHPGHCINVFIAQPQTTLVNNRETQLTQNNQTTSLHSFATSERKYDLDLFSKQFQGKMLLLPKLFSKISPGGLNWPDSAAPDFRVSFSWSEHVLSLHSFGSLRNICGPLIAIQTQTKPTVFLYFYCWLSNTWFNDSPQGPRSNHVCFIKG